MIDTKICTKRGFEKPLQAFHKCKASNDGHHWQCAACSIAYEKNRLSSDSPKILEQKERTRAYIRQYEKTNADRIRRRKKQYYLDNKHHISFVHSRYYFNNQEAIDKRNRENSVKNPARARAYYKSYMTAKKQRYPPYANEDKIKIKYMVAQIMTNITGVQYEVDHTHPLQGKLVSGLHHEDNLQVIKRSKNRRKSKSFTPQFIKINCSFIKYSDGEQIYQLT
ncbi:MAG: hypothetical protein P1S60_07095 [Anaerolineae bacterium]|nr:hypothetical protein [Anaerolineae bacterium]